MLLEHGRLEIEIKSHDNADIVLNYKIDNVAKLPHLKETVASSGIEIKIRQLNTINETLSELTRDR